MSPLLVEVAVPGALARSEPAPVTVTVINDSAEPVVVNRRMAPGYRDSDSRELWAEVRDPDGVPVETASIDYERDYPGPGDYGELAPGESISTQFDLFHYARPQAAGRYRLVVVYQADEPTPSRPAGVVTGEHASQPVALEVG